MQYTSNSQEIQIRNNDLYTSGIDITGNMNVTPFVNFIPETGISSNLYVTGNINTRDIKFSPNKIELGNSSSNLFRITNNMTTSTGYMQIQPSTGEFWVNATNVSTNTYIRGELLSSIRLVKEPSIQTSWIQPMSGLAGIKFSNTDTSSSVFRLYTDSVNKIDSAVNHNIYGYGKFKGNFVLTNSNNLPFTFYNYELTRANSIINSNFAYHYNTEISVSDYTAFPIADIIKYRVNVNGYITHIGLWTYVRNGQWWIYAKKPWSEDPTLIRIRLMIINNRLVEPIPWGDP